MVRSTPTSIITYLDTNWVGDKPKWVNQFENEMIKTGGSVGVNWADVIWEAMTAGFASKDEERNHIIIQVHETTLAALLLTWDQCRDLLKVKPLAGGHYMITDANPIKIGNYYDVFLTLEEVMSLV